MPFQAPRGTQDVLPDRSHCWQWLEREFLSLAFLYGYRELRTPTFEDEAVFTRTSGETSDIVTKQMYNFKDKGGRDICLKPEETAPLVRAVVEHNLCPTGTIGRFCYVTPIFRYERPQKGRLREAHQVGLEVIGSPSVEADAEIIEITVQFYRRLGLRDLHVKLNSLGREECRKRYREAILNHAVNYLVGQEDEVREKAMKNPLRLLDSKDPEVIELMATAPSILDYLEPECKERFDELQELLDSAGVSYAVDSAIVRGLDYYTETVFEVVSTKLGAQSSLCGGGRYDGLVKELGGAPTPSVGVAMGIERALIVLEEEGHLPALPILDAYVAYTGEATRGEARMLTASLRCAGVSVITDLEGKSLKSQLKQADRAGVRYVVLIGEDELARREVALRCLATGEQVSVAIGEIAGKIKGPDPCK